jgi:hypothetical protein
MHLDCLNQCGKLCQEFVNRTWSKPSKVNEEAASLSNAFTNKLLAATKQVSANSPRGPRRQPEEKEANRRMLRVAREN